MAAFLSPSKRLRYDILPVDSPKPASLQAHAVPNE